MAEVLSVDGDSPSAGIVGRAARCLAAGELLIYPTDTQYALGGRAWHAAAALAVRRAKGREEGKPLPLIAADLQQARSLCSRWPAAAQRLAERFWPGPLTLVVPASRTIPAEVTAGSPGLAVRVPALELARALCRACGPLLSTSANRSGGPAPVTCADALRAVGEAATLALDAGPGGALGSTIVDLTTDPPRLLRAGPVAWPDVEGALAASCPKP